MAIIITVILVLIFIIIAFILLNIIVAFITADSEKISGWNSEEFKKEYETAYNELMEEMPDFTWKKDVQTDFGIVRAYKWENEENKDKIPFVLFPGRSSGVPMWKENLSGLINNRPVIAIDALGDAGLSIQTRKFENFEDVELAINQTLKKLGLSEFHLVGHSWGD